MKNLARNFFVCALIVSISVIHIACPGTNEDDDNIQPNPEIVLDTMKDSEGNVYQTVTIGTQTWMAENLRVRQFNDCSPIPLTDYDHWWPSDSPQMAYLADDSSNLLTRGMLYNWHVINSGKLAPPGWHVPTREEWQTLIDHAGGAAVAGGKLKKKENTLWLTPNTGATDEFGFAAEPGYLRTAQGHTLVSSGELFFHNQTANFWTSTADDDLNAGYQHMAYNSRQSMDGLYPKTYALAVRLVKD